MLSALLSLVKLSLVALLLVAPLTLGRRRFGIGGGAHGLAAGFVLLGLCGLTYPWFDGRIARWGPFIALAILNATLALAPMTFWERFARVVTATPKFIRYPAPYILMPAVALGLCESVIQRLSERGLVANPPPLITAVPPGTADNRILHGVLDQDREPDPVLFWRPRPATPYNSQRFRGPLVLTPKPPGVFRIMCYGDSNTEGHREGAPWSQRLQSLLAQDTADGRRYEVMNAGVAGYSSYQGLLRFKQDVGIYNPDLVFVSFGWNDASGVIGIPDNAYRPPPELAAKLMRFLQDYRSYLLLRSYLSRRTPLPTVEQLKPRVSIMDYVANLRGFVEGASRHGAVAVLLTRPHLEAPEELPASLAWLRKVPEYNAALRAYGEAEGVPVVDVERVFSTEPSLFVDSSHITEEGHGLLATTLHDWILESRPQNRFVR